MIILFTYVHNLFFTRFDSQLTCQNVHETSPNVPKRPQTFFSVPIRYKTANIETVGRNCQLRACTSTTITELQLNQSRHQWQLVKNMRAWFGLHLSWTDSVFRWSKMDIGLAVEVILSPAYVEMMRVTLTFILHLSLSVCLCVCLSICLPASLSLSLSFQSGGINIRRGGKPDWLAVAQPVGYILTSIQPQLPKWNTWR